MRFFKSKSHSNNKNIIGNKENELKAAAFERFYTIEKFHRNE
jgi:hypothetical protein